MSVLLGITIGTPIFILICLVLIVGGLLVKSELEKGRNNERKVRELELQLKDITSSTQLKLKENELQMKATDSEMKVKYQQWALQELEKFKKAEIDRIEMAAAQRFRSEAHVQLKKWMIEKEAEIRDDAIKRSYSVNLGKITEHLIPFHASFLSQFNPKDARFIGSPIDLIVFDGYADKHDDITIYMVEIKTGNSKLTEVQKRIKSAVINGNIRWAEINPDRESKENGTKDQTTLDLRS